MTFCNGFKSRKYTPVKYYENKRRDVASKLRLKRIEQPLFGVNRLAIRFFIFSKILFDRAHICMIMLKNEKSATNR